jgi:hypothetical protein
MDFLPGFFSRIVMSDESQKWISYQVKYYTDFCTFRTSKAKGKTLIAVYDFYRDARVP